MLNSTRIGPLVGLVLIMSTCLIPLHAQDQYDENSHLNTNLAFPITVPVGDNANFFKLGTGVVAGAGYNFDRHNAFVGEFMWNWLYPTDQSLAPLRSATQLTGLNGHSNLFTLTANYRLEMQGHTLGAYLIGGGGLYYRNASLNSTVTVPPGTPCLPAWSWWGFPCSGGTVLVSQTRSSFNSAVFGGNAGAGFTIKVGEPRYRLYFEARYHYAPSSNFNLRMIPVTTGIRF